MKLESGVADELRIEHLLKLSIVPNFGGKIAAEDKV